jgi:hypothetical protein
VNLTSPPGLCLSSDRPGRSFCGTRSVIRQGRAGTRGNLDPPPSRGRGTVSPLLDSVPRIDRSPGVGFRRDRPRAEQGGDDPGRCGRCRGEGSADWGARLQARQSEELATVPEQPAPAWGVAEAVETAVIVPDMPAAAKMPAAAAEEA